MEKKRLPKLSLSRETIRLLSTEQLKGVEGKGTTEGGVTQNCTALCSRSACTDC